MLREWHSGGAGVMILGYDMYRNLCTGSHCKNKKQKAAFFETLADPGNYVLLLVYSMLSIHTTVHYIK